MKETAPRKKAGDTRNAMVTLAKQDLERYLKPWPLRRYSLLSLP